MTDENTKLIQQPYKFEGEKPEQKSPTSFNFACFFKERSGCSPFSVCCLAIMAISACVMAVGFTLNETDPENTIALSGMGALLLSLSILLCVIKNCKMDNDDEIELAKATRRAQQ